jgi:hypothetical protein
MNPSNGRDTAARLLSDRAALTNAVKHGIFGKNFAMDVSS